MLHLLNISFHNIRQATQAYYRIQTNGRTDLNFNIEPVSPVSHSVKFSWFLPEFIVLKSWNRRSKSGSSPSSEYSWIRWEKYRFSLQLSTRMHGFKYEFSKIFWGGGSPSPLPRLLPRSISGFALDSGFALNSRALRSLDRFELNPQFTPPTCLLTPPQQRGIRSNTVPQPQLLVFPNTGPKISFQEYVVGLKYTIYKIIGSRLRELFENPLIQLDERCIPEHTALGIIAPDASILVQNAPKSLAAGASSQTPLGELTALSQTP